MLIGRKVLAESAGFCARLVVERHVHPDAGRQREPVVGRPLVLRVEAELLHVELRHRPFGTGLGGEHALECRGSPASTLSRLLKAHTPMRAWKKALSNL